MRSSAGVSAVRPGALPGHLPDRREAAPAERQAYGCHRRAAGEPWWRDQAVRQLRRVPPGAAVIQHKPWRLCLSLSGGAQRHRPVTGRAHRKSEKTAGLSGWAWLWRRSAKGWRRRHVYTATLAFSILTEPQWQRRKAHASLFSEGETYKIMKDGSFARIVRRATKTGRRRLCLKL